MNAVLDYLHRHRTPALIGFFVSVTSGVFTIEDKFFPSSNAKRDMAAVVKTDGQETRTDLRQWHDDVSHRFDELNHRLSTEPPPSAPQAPQTATPAPEESGPIAPPAPIAAAPAGDRSSPKPKQTPFRITSSTTQPPFRCDSVLAGATAIPFYVKATVTGTSEIGSDAIEQSIVSHLPAENFYPAKLEKCAALLIHAWVDVGTDSDSNKAYAKTEIYYGSNRNSPTQSIIYSCSESYDVAHINWSKASVVSNSIYANITDARLAKFILSDFGIKLNVLAEAERPMSQCEAVRGVYRSTKDRFRPG